MKNINFAIFALVFTLFSYVAEAQTKIGNVTLSNALSISVPVEKEQKFQIDYYRIKTEGVEDDFSAVLDYEIVKNNIFQCFAKYSKKIGTDGEVNIIAGKFFDPVWNSNLIAGPRTLQETRWETMLYDFPFFCEGAQFGAQYKDWNFKAAVFNGTEKKQFATSLENNYGSIFFVQDVGYGGFTRIPLPANLKLSVGASHFVTDVNSAFVKAEIDVLAKIHLMVEGDFNSKKSPEMLTGVTYTYKPNSFLKLYWDSEVGFQGKVTYAF